MSVRLYIKDHPHRTLALSAHGHVLVFRHTHVSTEHRYASSSSSLTLSNPKPALPPRCMVEFVANAELDLSSYRSVSSAQGTAGLITLNNDVFLCIITGSSQVAAVRPRETVQKIHSVEFYCLNKSDYDHTHGHEPNPYQGQNFSSDEIDYGGGLDQTDSTAEHPFHALKKLLSGGNFYYSVDFDLTSRLQDRAEAESSNVDIESLDEGLLWNSYMISPLVQFRSRLTEEERTELDHSGMLTSVIRGFVKTLTIPPCSAPMRRDSSNLPSSLTLISRLSSRRAGTRFNSRGVDDDGNVANFVETETVFWSASGVCFSYVQVRGSIPIFWESSSSLIPGQQKIQITRSPEATQPAFDKHFEYLERTYGAVHIVNLLSATKAGEVELTERYRHHTAHSPLRRGGGKNELSEQHLLLETEFDFHAETKAGGYGGANAIRPYLETSAEGFAYFMSEDVTEQAAVKGARSNAVITRPIVVLQQEGVFRVNCLDCLDRTNLVQGLISQMALESFVTARAETATTDFWMRHSSLWADNGDTLSQIYAGTGALKSSFTRHGKMSLAGAIADARKSATRLYVNNFADKGRQNTIDLLLGRLVGQAPVHLYDPISDFVTTELRRKAPEYTSTHPIHILVGTFNLNGKTTGASEDLSPWLCAKANPNDPDPDIVAVGFQEIVELSPQQIMSTDPHRRRIWEHAVKDTLNNNASKKSQDDYVLLRCGQLVGAALMLFVKASVLQSVKDVEGSIKKTGLSGIAGNKGAVAIRLEYGSTTICFVTAHLAAGFANYEERNRDYRTISQGLRFQKNRGIEDHDSIIWLGDFNYRIGLSDDRVRKLIKDGDLSTLYENDQLNIQMVAGMAFQFYNEGKIEFMPTYKYDLGMDQYDTSDKQRIPAWCDRVVWKTNEGGSLKQSSYNAAPLRFSDHRPVNATFECAVRFVNEKAKAKLAQELYEKRKKDVGGAHAARNDGAGDSDTGSDDDGNLMGYESTAPGLPPASSDRRKWWLDQGLPAKSKVGPPKEGMVSNPRRPGNPWRDTSEPDWVEIQRPSSTVRAARRLQGNAKPEPPPPRKRMVPPAWDGERSIPWSATSASKRPGTNGMDGATDMRGQPPPPPPPPARKSSVSSVTSFVPAKKAPPPKPKKPLDLVYPNTGNTSLAAESPTKKLLPSRTNISSSVSPSISAESENLSSKPEKTSPRRVEPRRMSKLRKENSTSSIRSRSSSNASDDGRGREPDVTGPKLPPRRARTNMALMDEAGGDMASWEPLVPA